MYATSRILSRPPPRTHDDSSFFSLYPPPPPPPPPLQKTTKEDAWLNAIETATQCILRTTTRPTPTRSTANRRGDKKDNHGGGDDDEFPAVAVAVAVDASIDYLATLEADLMTIMVKEKDESSSSSSSSWQSSSLPPCHKPPPFVFPRSGGNDERQAPENTPRPLVPSQVTQQGGRGTTNNKTTKNDRSNNNPFASIALSDDEEEDHDDDEAGDTPLLNRDHHHDTPTPTPAPTTSSSSSLSVLRLLIRIHTVTSDLWAYKGTALVLVAASSKQEWTLGAAAIQCAIQTIRQALELADSQISKCYYSYSHEDDDQEEEPSTETTMTSRKKEQQQQQQQEERRRRLLLLQDLQDDADIVHVAIQSLVTARDNYRQMAQRQKQRLEKILAPQWESRDQAKQRMGKDRWVNNPRPKHEYAQLRRESELELRQLETALQSLYYQQQHQQQVLVVNEEEGTLDGLSASAQFLKLRLVPTNRHRYNGKRPEEERAPGIRLEGYPDATTFGWTFTGSNATSRVEFFQRLIVVQEQQDQGSTAATIASDSSSSVVVLVKLDFYYTTGTVKTSMEHPKQGKTQLFCPQDQITPELYVELLKNPRVHTDGQRYQTKP